MRAFAIAMIGLSGGCGDKDEPRSESECVDYQGEDCASVGLPDEQRRATCGDCGELWVCYGSENSGYSVFRSYHRCSECITEDGYLDTTLGGPCDHSLDSPD